MSQTHISGARVKLPSGKDAGLVDILSFCYGLSETDVQVLVALAKADAKGTEDLEEDLKLSKASINRSLNKLLEMGLVMRIKEPGNKAGRPRYLYKTRGYKELKEKILEDIRNCAESMAKLVDQEFSISETSEDIASAKNQGFVESK
ncbi:HTH-type transcriptional regulator Lrs14 [Stygiolobus azoricus]|uniref:ArsR family transcriptional regulator n=1 Tax=Stygiolobus azoricus TaxID=41675 RepID=A0A650CRV8_9CREN|nr:HTH-type transcriptional regulator Lrs14 [Stygiolobus azoricus]QGR20560.1 ArsR family transcriptional regulator [Stygiolobus azoricus]